MLCEICGKNEATFHYSEVINETKTEHHLCNECAGKTDISYFSNLFDNDGRLSQILASLLGNTLFGSKENDTRAHIACPNCKMTYSEFINKSKFGCSECYNVFGPLLDDSIKKIQGSTHHVGKKPKAYADMADASADVSKASANEEASDRKPTVASLTNSRNILNSKLKMAIAEEDFMEAARLRDEIKALTAQIEEMQADE